jgi:hypothetical protein
MHSFEACSDAKDLTKLLSDSIPDTVAGISSLAEAAIVAESIDRIARHVGELKPSPLQEGVKV